MSETAPKLTLFEEFKLKSSKQITAKIMEWKEKSVENVKSRSSSLSVYSRRESSTIDFGKYALPRLKNGVFEEADIEYKTGARYKGQVHGTKKAGKGTFTWPNGAKYEGEFVDDVRQGHGIQTFEDGTVYDGEFKDDMRHGDGMMTWPNRETYEGKFFKDRRHGFGSYMWPDRSYYKGMFYMDLKEGYGKFCFADGTKFQGLYKCDERHGPGVQTYKDGCEDVGLWQREKLVRLCTDLDGAFTIKNTEFASSADDNQPLYIYPEYFKNRTDIIESILNPPEQFSYPPDVDIASKAAEEIFSEFLYRKSLAVDIRAFDEAFFDADVVKRVMSRAEKSAPSPVKSETVNEEEEEEGQDTGNATPTIMINDRAETPKKTESRQGSAVSTVSTVPVDPSVCHEGLGVIDEETKVAVWNKTPSIVAMQKHVIRHQNSQKYVKFDLQKIIEGDRYEFGYPGPLEEASVEFLKAASEGDLNKMADMLAEEKVHVDVADKSGHTALLGAAVNCEQDVINCLLDNGADVNKLSDEGVSALTAAHVFFYPSERFRYNIAEHQGAPPANMEREPGYDVNEAVKGLLGTKRPGAGAAKKQTEEEKIDERKINELRKEYEFMKDSKDSLDKLAVEDSKKDRVKSGLKPTGHGGKRGSRSSFNGDRKGSRNSLSGGRKGSRTSTSGERKGSKASVEEEKHLGKLKFKRASHTDVDDALAIDHSKPPQTHSETRVKKPHPHSKSDEKLHKKDAEEFSSNVSIQDYPIDVSNQLINKGIAALTHNEMVTEREKSDPSSPSSLGTVRRMAITKKEERAMEATIRLLLQRGADPNASAVPMPPLFFAVKAADVEAVRLLLLKGASTEAKLPDHKKGLTALHIATALPGEEGVKMTELLLNALANPDVKAVEDDSFLNRNLLSPQSAGAKSSQHTSPKGSKNAMKKTA